MDIIETIRTRRSIRKFTSEPVTDDQIRTILEAASMAPSAGNAQPWQFVVIRDRDILDRVKSINPYAAMADQAPLSILVCGDLSLEKFPGFWVQDCSACVENLLLAVHGIGLGGVWTGIYPMEDRIDGFRRLLGLPDNVIPLALVVIGHPDQTLPSPSRYKPERVHRERWGG